jgi:hypothetical protein
MNLLARRGLAIQAFWMGLALAAAFYVLADNLSYAAWNGVNLVMSLYLSFSFVGFVGLTLALIKWSSEKPLFAWIAGLSAFAIACEALIFAAGFIYGRNPSIPLGESGGAFGIHAPLLAFYGFCVVSCSIQVLLSFLKYRQLKATR